jgi:ornithine racemase
VSAPRLEIDLGRLHHNAHTLVQRLARRGIAVTGVSKATLGLVEIVRTWVAAGVGSIGESRIETIEALARAGVSVPLMLLRSPMLSQVGRVVAHASISCNSEPVVLRALATAAAEQGRRHAVLLMVELGDLREGILPADLEAVAQLTLQLPALRLIGIGANLGCQHGVRPGNANMAELSALAMALEARFGVVLELVSGGNSANLPWLAAGGDPGRINHLRLGEALLLGREPLNRTAIPGLHTDAITLVAEVIEARVKPSRPWGDRGLTSFAALGSPAAKPAVPADQAPRQRALLALGEQDVDPAGLVPPAGVTIVGASSDHLVVEQIGGSLLVGQEQWFGLDYSSLLRAMTSPFVSRCFVANGAATTALPEGVVPRSSDVPDLSAAWRCLSRRIIAPAVGSRTASIVLVPQWV